MVLSLTEQLRDRCQHAGLRHYRLQAGLCMLAFLACGRLAAQPPITALAFAPEGDAVLAGSQSGVSVYSWPDLQLRQQLECRSENVHDIAFAMDAKRFAVGGGLPSQAGYVEFYTWPACTSLGSTAEHQDSVLSVTWLDDLLLASSSLDHEILIWDSQQLK
ncbi:MAG: hypothetical protein NXI32_28460, partial [bacterium]|nr:hypothetical protein [bacterium]